MKKTSLLIASLFASVCLFAQSSAKFGLKAGVNIASIKIEDFDNTDSRIGFHVGGLAHIHLAPQWAIQPELQYSMEGGKINVSGGDVDVKLDYINIPVMIQYMFNNGFRLEAGPYLGLMVGSKYEDDDGNEDDADDEFKSTNVGLGFGLNYLTHSGFGIGGRYNLGLSDISDNSTNIKQRTFQISLFYMFDNDHKAKSR